jgi:hypothetical protein
MNPVKTVNLCDAIGSSESHPHNEEEHADIVEGLVESDPILRMPEQDLDALIFRIG